MGLIAVVAGSDQAFERRAVAFDLLSLPVPADLLVYTREEWERLQAGGGRFARTLSAEVVWIYPYGG